MRKGEIERLEKAVDAFACAMKIKLREKAEQGFTGWNQKDMRGVIGRKIREQIVNGTSQKTLVNIANLCMMLWYQRKRA